MTTTGTPEHYSQSVADIAGAVDNVENVVGYNVTCLHAAAFDIRELLCDSVRTVEQRVVESVELRLAQQRDSGRLESISVDFTVEVDELVPVSVFCDRRRLADAVKEVCFSAALRADRRVVVHCSFAAEKGRAGLDIRG